jgi:hypothetical protein
MATYLSTYSVFHLLCSPPPTRLLPVSSPPPTTASCCCLSSYPLLSAFIACFFSSRHLAPSLIAYFFFSLDLLFEKKVLPSSHCLLDLYFFFLLFSYIFILERIVCFNPSPPFYPSLLGYLPPTPPPLLVFRAANEIQKMKNEKKSFFGVVGVSIFSHYFTLAA